ncbi:siderophore-iron reductase FhuF [Pseudoroseomonas globiformis]|uniref:Siderophore-iron reductase FhuF n=1 Tax=Teichococcus globiformis TaxID=2307229 RepID=A0ABV7G9J8_9PROT
MTPEPASRSIPDLAAAFDGPFCFARGSLVLEAEGLEAVPCSTLLEGGRIGELVARFGAGRYPGADATAVLSMWSQFYMTVLIYPVFATRLLLRREMVLDPGDTALVLGSDAAPMALQLAGPGQVLADAMDEPSLRRFLVQHLEPMVSAIAAAGRISAKVIWGNAGVRIGHALRMLAARPEVRPAAEVLMQRLFSDSSWPGGGENPLQRTFHAAASPWEEAPRRRVCCLRYHLPGLEQGCGTCPLPRIQLQHAA